MTSLLPHDPLRANWELREINGPTPRVPLPFQVSLIDKLADLLVAASEVMDLISASTNSRSRHQELAGKQADEAFRNPNTAQVARTVESIYEQVNRLMLSMTD